MLILVLPWFIAAKCPTEMNGQQVGSAMKASMSDHDQETQRRVSGATRNYTRLDPKAIVDSFTEPCMSCNNNDINGRGSRRGGSSRLASNFKKLGGNSKALAQALCFMNKNAGKTKFKSGAGGRISIKEKCKFIINDYTKPANKKRMFVVNKCTGNVDVVQVAQGKGGISNRSGSKATPSGFHVTGGTHNSKKRWAPGIKLHGLQRGVNDNTYARAVVMHRAISSRGAYCGGGIAKSSQSKPDTRGTHCGNSWGCPAVHPNHWKALQKLKGNRSGGTMVYNFSSRESGKGSSYCGDRLWK